MTAVTFTSWLLALHLLAASALVGSLTLFIIATIAARGVDEPERAVALSRIVAAASPVLGAGLFVTAGLGVWLVFDMAAYSILDGWIVAAIALWLLVGALSGQSIVEQHKATVRVADLAKSGETDYAAIARELHGRGVLALRAGAALAAMAALAVMIWKPGA